jgi:hypothetical protein
MYQEHPVCRKPADEDVDIWQYMKWAKFVSILQCQALFFSRVDRLKTDDPYEGAFPKNYSNPDIKRLYQKWQITDQIAANCWHMNEYESAAMWRLYAPGEPDIAIQSTFRQLTNSFNSELRDVFVGEISYMDYEIDPNSDGDNMLSFCLHKRYSFRHEQELRALIILYPSSGGVRQLENLI